MDRSWLFAIDIAYLALFIAIASMIKVRVKMLKDFIIPTAILAGFIGLILGPEVLNLISFDADTFGRILYHLMAIGFIALSLKERETKRNKNIVNSGIYIVTTYLIQGIVGFGVTLILLMTIYPDIFPGFGLLLPLGYGQGPGQAFSIGGQWEKIGFLNGGNIGLTIATFGFLWASLIGVPLMNFLMRRNRLKRRQKIVSMDHKPIQEEMEPDDIPLSASLDKLSMQLSLIGIIYLITYLTLVGATRILEPLGAFGETFAQLLWGFHFNIGAAYAILFRFLFDRLKKKNITLYHEPNNYLLQRIAGASFDFMITASIAAISIHVVKVFIGPILVLTTLGGILTILYTIMMCKIMFKENTLENALGFYGMMTGTISTGMALLKGVDPNFDTDAAENLVIGSAVALVFGLPLMAILNLPIFGYVSGQPLMYLYTLLLFGGYFMFLHILIRRNLKK